jgi:cobalt-zinc-cadmium efflux system outer membrane protein
MPWFRSATLRNSVTFVGMLTLAGCHSTGGGQSATVPVNSAYVSNNSHRSDLSERRQEKSADEIAPVSHVASVQDVGLVDNDADDPFRDATTLQLEVLIEQVQVRNPSLEAVRAAWGAASQKYPQAVALEDPVFQSMYAPQSFTSSSNVQSSYYLGISQKLPWSGKRELRGQQANWEANAASFDVGETSLRLAEASRVAFLDYYLNERLRELLDSNIEAASDFRTTAKVKYEANQVTQQDVLQADVELAQLEQRQIELLQDRGVAIARINTLLHRRPDHPLPPPPAVLPAVDDLSPVNTLRRNAADQRPELQAMASRVQAEQHAVELAYKEFLPDFEVMGRYDRFWTDKEQRGQVGVNMNVPLNRSRRNAAAQEAIFRVHKLQAELNQARDNLANDVQSAFVRMTGAINTVKLYENRILPASSENVSAAVAGYTAGTVDFLRLIQAQREKIELQEKHQTAVTELHRRRAELERAVGGPISMVPNSAAFPNPSDASTGPSVQAIEVGQ